MCAAPLRPTPLSPPHTQAGTQQSAGVKAGCPQSMPSTPTGRNSDTEGEKHPVQRSPELPAPHWTLHGASRLWPRALASGSPMSRMQGDPGAQPGTLTIGTLLTNPFRGSGPTPTRKSMSLPPLCPLALPTRALNGVSACENGAPGWWAEPCPSLPFEANGADSSTPVLDDRVTGTHSPRNLRRNRGQLII